MTVVAATLIAAVLLAVVRVAAVIRVGPIGARTLVPRLPAEVLRLPGADGGNEARLRAWPLPLAVSVDADGGEVLAGVGRLVARSLFPPSRYPPFEVRVLHVSPRPAGAGRPGPWSDASSPLCGVHLALFEVDARAARWRCPFGYRDDATLDVETLVRLVKADWSYFMGYLWGVPLDAAAGCDAVALASLRVAEGVPLADAEGAAKGGGRQRIELAPVEVASPGRARADGRERSPPDRIVGAAWRLLLGSAPPGEGRQSFGPLPLRVRAELWHRELADAEGGRLHRTTILCAVAHDDAADAPTTLGAGLEALRSIADRLGAGPPIVS